MAIAHDSLSMDGPPIASLPSSWRGKNKNVRSSSAKVIEQGNVVELLSQLGGWKMQCVSAQNQCDWLVFLICY
jgi:hypothetical protein